jgi:hypothetical protein
MQGLMVQVMNYEDMLVDMVLYWWCVHEDSNCVFKLCNISPSLSSSFTRKALIDLFQPLLIVPSKVFQVAFIHLNTISHTFHYCDGACVWSSRAGVAYFQYRRWWNGTFWAVSCKGLGSHFSRVKRLFSTQKHLDCSPPCLLFNGYRRSVPWVRGSQAWRQLHTPLWCQGICSLNEYYTYKEVNEFKP